MQIAKDAAYPNGIENPSIVTVPVNVISGWPSPQRLDSLVTSENVVISVFKVPNMERDVPEFWSNWQDLHIDSVANTGIGIREIGRQESAFWVIVWAKNESARETIVEALNVAYRAALSLSLPNGERARIKYHRRLDDDNSQKLNLYRSTLIYSVEYAATQTKEFNVVTDVDVNATYS